MISRERSFHMSRSRVTLPLKGLAGKERGDGGEEGGRTIMVDGLARFVIKKKACKKLPRNQDNAQDI